MEMCRALGEQGHSVILYIPEAPLTPIPPLTGCEIRISNFKGPWRRVIWSLTELPGKANSDCLDLFWGPAHRLPPRLASNIPTVLTIHDLVWRKAPETMRWQTWIGERAFMQASLRRAEYIAAVSNATANDIVDLQPDVAGRTQVIYPGLTRLPQPGGRAMAPVDSHGNNLPYALFVGTLEPRKNLVRLLQAFASVAMSELSDLMLVIAGGQGWRHGDLSELIKQYGIQDRVILTGYVSDSELSQLYASARFLLMPSLYEGFGFPIIESQSFGVPVITSNVSSMPEVGGIGALLVDPLSTVDISNAMVRLASCSQLRSELGDAARINAARFSWHKASRELIGLMKDT